MRLKLTGGYGVERAFDASGSDKGRLTAIQATRKWGKIALVGEGGTLTLSPSYDMIHDQKTVYGSWVTSIWLMEDLVGADCAMENSSRRPRYKQISARKGERSVCAYG